MSGGRFNWAYLKVDDTDVFQGLSDYREIEQYLRELGKTGAADLIRDYIQEVETARDRLFSLGRDVADLMQSAEWVASGDSSESLIDEDYAKLIERRQQGKDLHAQG